MLDIHPEPVHSVVEVQVGSDCITVGRLDETDLIGRIHTARGVVASLIGAGYFEPDRTTRFEFVYHFESVDTWLAYMSEHWASAGIDPSIVSSSRDLLGSNVGELRIREWIHAACLRRLYKDAVL